MKCDTLKRTQMGVTAIALESTILVNEPLSLILSRCRCKATNVAEQHVIGIIQ